MTDLDPRIKVKTGRTYSKYVRQDEKKVKSSIKRLIKKNAKGVVGLTADMWDDRKQNSFCSLTVHYIDEDFKLVRATPAIKWFGNSRHTSDNIAETLKEEIKAVTGDEDPLVVLVTDSTNNMVKTRRLLKEAEVIDQEFGCSNHKIQNSIKDAIKDTNSVGKLIAKAKKLSKHIRKSTVANNFLKAACCKSSHKFVRMKSCIDIRWNSEHDCLERLLYHQECLEYMDRKRQLDKVSESMLNREDWRVLDAVVKILRPVKIATKVLESETEPTINRVAETIFDAEEHLKDVDSDESAPDKAKHFAKNLRKSLQRRFPNFGLDEKVVGFGNFLDPHLKGVHLDQIGRLEQYVNAVSKAISGYEAPSGDTEEEIVIENEKLTPTEKLLRKKNNPLSEVFDIRSSGVKEAEEEIKVYRQLPLCPRSESILTWWKSHADVLPRLTVFAKQILAIPASSSSSERLFSIAGLFDTVKRGNLKLETLETLTLFKTNKKLLEDNIIEVDNESGRESDKEESDMDDSEDECDVMETDDEDINMTEEDGQMDTDVEQSSEEENYKASWFLYAHFRTGFGDICTVYSLNV